MVYQFYRYEPSLAPAIIALVAFSITTALHVYQLSKTRAWYMLPMIVGGISILCIVRSGLTASDCHRLHRAHNLSQQHHRENPIHHSIVLYRPCSRVFRSNSIHGPRSRHRICQFAPFVVHSPPTSYDYLCPRGYPILPSSEFRRRSHGHAILKSQYGKLDHRRRIGHSIDFLRRVLLCSHRLRYALSSPGHS